MSGTGLSVCPFTLKSPGSSYSDCPHSAGEKTEDCPRPHTWEWWSWDLSAGLSDVTHVTTSSSSRLPSLCLSLSLTHTHTLTQSHTHPQEAGPQSLVCLWLDRSSFPTLLQFLLNTLICKYKGLSEAQP